MARKLSVGESVESLRAELDASSWDSEIGYRLLALVEQLRLSNQTMKEALERIVEFDGITALDIARAALSELAEPRNAASAPCTRCGATPETGQTDGCGECEGILDALLAEPEREG